MKNQTRPCMLALALAACLHAGDRWPQFRGPAGGAADLDAKLPAVWDDGSVLWKAPLPGEGNSSAIAWDGAVFATAGSRDGKTRWTIRFDAVTGKEVWRKELALTDVKKHKKNTHATATPATDGERVYAVFGGSEGVFVVAYAMNGSELWKRRLGDFEASHASGGSPIAHGGNVIVPFDHDGPSALVCLEGATGNEKWRAPRPGKLAAYSTPLVVGDTVVASSTAAVAAFDLKTGKPAWEQALFGKRVVASPMLAEGRVYAASGQGNKGELAALLDPAAGGKPAFTLTAGLPYCTTPLAGPGRLLMVGDIGVARMLDAKDGKQLWEQRLAGSTFFGSPVRAGDAVYVVEEKGGMHCFAWADAFKPLGRGQLDDIFRSTPAVAGNRMFLRGEKFLWCVGK